MTLDMNHEIQIPGTHKLNDMQTRGITRMGVVFNGDTCAFTMPDGEHLCYPLWARGGGCQVLDWRATLRLIEQRRNRVVDKRRFQARLRLEDRR